MYRIRGECRQTDGDVLGAQFSFQHDRELLELRSLPGLGPACRASHVRDAGGGSFRIDASYVFVDEFGLVSGGCDPRGLGNQGRHGSASGVPASLRRAHELTTIPEAIVQFGSRQAVRNRDAPSEPFLVTDTDRACPASAECPEWWLPVRECHPGPARRESPWAAYPAFPACSKFRDPPAYQAQEAALDAEESAARPPDVRPIASPRHPLLLDLT